MLLKVKKLLLIFSGLLFLALLLLMAAAWPHRNAIPVLNYHQINNSAHNALTVNTEQFEAQMKYLTEKGYHTISPSELADAMENAAALPENPVLITFDDGYLDNYNNAFPILKKYNMKATIFLISDYVSVYPNYVTWDKAIEMQENQIDFESHTLNHVELTKVSPEECLYQLTNSKRAIEWHLQKNVSFIAYPCGSYNDEVQKLVRQAGYRGAFTVHYGMIHPGDNMYALDRVPIFGGNSHTLLRFKLRLHYAPVCIVLHDIRDRLFHVHPLLAHLVPIP